jgi:hypothetical protein
MQHQNFVDVHIDTIAIDPMKDKFNQKIPKKHDKLRVRLISIESRLVHELHRCVAFK